jgi:hypothetical protein
MMQYTQIKFDQIESVMVNDFAPKKMEIDFESISMEQEYFYGYSDKIFAESFIGEENESTEIDSIVNSITNTDMSTSVIPSAGLETGEILEILKRPQINNNEFQKSMSKSNPNFYYARKISMQGRVIKSENEVKKDENCQVRKTVPVRCLNPIMKNLGSTCSKESSMQAHFSKY